MIVNFKPEFIFKDNLECLYLDNLIQDPDVELSSDFFWKPMWFYFHKNSDLKKAYLWKKLSLNHFLSTLENKEDVFHIVLQKVKTSTWLGNHHLVQENVEKLKDLCNSPQETKIYYAVFNNLKCLTGHSKDFYPIDIQPNFLEFIKNKNIIISGSSTQGDHILSSKEDVLVKMNYLGIHDKVKLDISYYNKQTFMENRDLIVSLLERNIIKFVVVNNLNPKKQCVGIDSQILQRIKSNYAFTLTHESHLMGLQRVIFDLLMVSPKSIFIKDINFYTQYPYHSKQYNVTVTGMNNLLSSWSIHDLFFNFSIMRSLFQRGIISGDETFEKIMYLDIDDYICLVEELSKRQIQEDLKHDFFPIKKYIKSIFNRFC